MTCRICNNKEENKAYEALEMMLGLREQFVYFQCGACYCLQIKSVPTDLARFYPTDYSGYEPPRSNYYGGISGAFRKFRYEATLFPDSALKSVFRSLFPAVEYEILSRFSLRKDSRILDIGCGRGHFLYPLYELGMKNVLGIEPFIPDTFQYPNGFSIEKGFAKDATGQWDIIVYNHSFEHVTDPLANLQAVKKLLKPGGVAIIRIPTVSSFAWEHYKTDWYQLDAPRHIFLHSVESMKLLAQQADMILKDVIYDSTEMQFLISDLYQRGIPLVDRKKQAKNLADYLRYKVIKWQYSRKAKQLNKQNRGDQAAFILQ